MQRIILEETGQMASLKNTVTLKGVVCQGTCAKNCPRSNPLYCAKPGCDASKNRTVAANRASRAIPHGGQLKQGSWIPAKASMI